MDNESARRILDRSFRSIALNVVGNALFITAVLALVDLVFKRTLPTWGDTLAIFGFSLVLYSIITFLSMLMGAGRYRRTGWNRRDDPPTR